MGLANQHVKTFPTSTPLAVGRNKGQWDLLWRFNVKQIDRQTNTFGFIIPSPCHTQGWFIAENIEQVM
jgi:hypothetical protein